MQLHLSFISSPTDIWLDPHPGYCEEYRSVQKFGTLYTHPSVGLLAPVIVLVVIFGLFSILLPMMVLLAGILTKALLCSLFHPHLLSFVISWPSSKIVSCSHYVCISDDWCSWSGFHRQVGHLYYNFFLGPSCVARPFVYFQTGLSKVLLLSVWVPNIFCLPTPRDMSSLQTFSLIFQVVSSLCWLAPLLWSCVAEFDIIPLV